jgi:16S rRNA processing protein RimM
VLEVGRITKPHGLRGDVLVRLLTTEPSRLDAGSVLIAGGRELTVEWSKPHHDRWIVSFEGVSGREAADELRGALLLGESVERDDDPDALWVHELIGAEVFDGSGTSYGRVEAVLDNPASDLLQLESGSLVPLTFVTGWIERGERLGIDPPEGLLDL